MERVGFTYKRQPMFGTVVGTQKGKLVINPDYVNDLAKVLPTDVTALDLPDEIGLAANLVPETAMEQLLAAANLELTRQLAAALEALAVLKGTHHE
jgi:hypothetical protein